ncbi:MAG TPA: AAA family ATPase [Pirellulales bacterium]|nr:AAA family ATPase [Pirellulales bacterium]
MSSCIFDEAMRAELAGDPLDWPGISEPGGADAFDGAPNADARRPRAEVKCPEIRAQRLGEIESEPTTWLWSDRFPLVPLTVMAGSSGVGKTFLALDLAARVTRGAGWPTICQREVKSGGESPHSQEGAATLAGSVVVMNAKDSTTQVLRPRLDAAGADVERVTIISPARQIPLSSARNSDLSALARRLNALQTAIIDAGDCRLAVVDDLDAWMGEFGLLSPATHICAFLDQLAAMAARTQTAIVCLARLSATPEGRIAYRELTNPLKSAQVVWLVANDHQEPGRMLLLPVTNNLAPQTPGLGFRLASATAGAAVVVWEQEPLGVTAAEVMAPGAGWVERRRDQDVAAEWLLTALDSGRIASNDLFRQAAECGIAVKTLRRAATQLGITPYKESFHGGWFWSAAASEGEEQGERSKGKVESASERDRHEGTDRPIEDGQLGRQTSQAGSAAEQGACRTVEGSRAHARNAHESRCAVRHRRFQWPRAAVPASGGV